VLVLAAPRKIAPCSKIRRLAAASAIASACSAIDSEANRSIGVSQKKSPCSFGRPGLSSDDERRLCSAACCANHENRDDEHPACAGEAR
jgi:hypothetical protein